MRVRIKQDCFLGNKGEVLFPKYGRIETIFCFIDAKDICKKFPEHFDLILDSYNYRDILNAMPNILSGLKYPKQNYGTEIVALERDMEIILIDQYLNVNVKHKENPHYRNTDFEKYIKYRLKKELGEPTE